MEAMLQGIDGDVELALELDQLSAHSPVAAGAPRGAGLTRYLARGFTAEAADESPHTPYWDLTVHLLQHLSIWWPNFAYGVLPTMTPWSIRDRSARYDQGPESWGAPRADGYFRDDNSIIKKLPLTLTVHAPSRAGYDGRKPWRGFTACHIWRELEGGTIGGLDPWIYSFMPNLVWLPRPLAGLTDYHSAVQSLLKRTSYALFRHAEVDGAREYSEYVWSLLAPNGLDAGRILRVESLARFNVDAGFVRRRLAYIDKVVSACSGLTAGEPIKGKLICSRYTEGLPMLERQVISELGDQLGRYAEAVRSSQLGASSGLV